ncbi:DMT family transporter [Hyphobacterium sp.]|jgi:drug/metabolite transporter (DMT)-like permease|uniref:DMT family transporter n=1 Tax=Hyphobacterium sp. TaxID=2004662 RepID=UPI003BAC77E3
MSGKPTHSTLITLTMLISGMALFGSATPVSRIIGQDFPVLLAAELRVLIGTLVLLPVAIGHFGTVPRLSRADWMRIAIIALFGMFGFTLLMLYGMRLIPGAAGAVVMSTAPAITAIGAIAFLGDRLTRAKALAIGLAVIGVLTLNLLSAGESGGLLLWGSLLVLAAVCCEAVYTLMGRRTTETVSPVLVAFLAAALSIPLFAPFALWQAWGWDWTTVSAASWVALVWYGAGTLALGSWVWYAGVSRASGSTAAGFMAVMPCSALLLSYLLLDEPFRWSHIAGFAIVLVSVLLMSREHAKMGQESERDS